MVMGPVGLGTKNHCTGEGQQQISSQSESGDSKIWSWVPWGPEPRMTVLAKPTTIYPKPKPKTATEQRAKTVEESAENFHYRASNQRLKCTRLVVHRICINEEGKGLRSVKSSLISVILVYVWKF
jgi:hypothetical protein